MRIKRGVNAVKKRRKIMKLAKGYFGSKSRSYRIAREAVMKSQMYAFIGRRRKKRFQKTLDRSYQRSGSHQRHVVLEVYVRSQNAGINLNRKVLADLAVNDANAFKALPKPLKSYCEISS
ncbi:MAG: 50S ribosomal protein L20 [Christensenellales bacterium]